jgi:protein gp37
MADHSKIEWTDATWNVVTGCSIESPGCTNCYAMKLAGTRLRNHPSRAGLTNPSSAGPVWTGEIRFNEQWLEQPLGWTKPRMIFVCAHGDLFHPGVPFEVIDKVFAVMALSPRHFYQVLTKRPARMLEYIDSKIREAFVGQQVGQIHLRRKGEPVSEWGGFPMPNVLLGCSVENQKWADLRRPAMEALAALEWKTWVSYEPALGPVAWSGWGFLKWLVSGGESGVGARPHLPDWHRDACSFCETFNIPYLFKQWGAWAPPDQFPKDAWTATHEYFDGQYLMHADKSATGRHLDGMTHDGFPVWQVA